MIEKNEQEKVDKLLKYICVKLVEKKGYLSDMKRQIGEWVIEGNIDLNDPQFLEKVDNFIIELRDGDYC